MKAKFELFNYGIYQAAGGKAVFRIPELDDKWKTYAFAKSDWRFIHCVAGEENRIWARIIITVPPKFVFKNKVTSEQVAASILLEIKKANPVYSQVMQAQKATIGGGSATFQALKGTNKKNVGVISAVIGIIDKDSTYAMWIVIEAPESIFEKVGNVVEKILPTVYVGKHIPTLADRKPSKRLEGVYIGSSINENYFLIFDKRGYYGNNFPRPLYLDFDVTGLFEKEEIRAYEIKGGKFIATDIYGDGKKNEYSITIEDNRIELFGRTYKRIDLNGPGDGERLDAKYENFQFESSTGIYSNFSFSQSHYITFSKEGTISLSSSISTNFTSFKDPFEMASDQMMYGDFTTIEGGNSVYGRNTDEGFYRIKDNFLTIIYTNGEIDIRTIYYKDGPKSLLFVDGSMYC